MPRVRLSEGRPGETSFFDSNLNDMDDEFNLVRKCCQASYNTCGVAGVAFAAIGVAAIAYSGFFNGSNNPDCWELCIQVSENFKFCECISKFFDFY